MSPRASLPPVSAVDLLQRSAMAVAGHDGPDLFAALLASLCETLGASRGIVCAFDAAEARLVPRSSWIDGATTPGSDVVVPAELAARIAGGDCGPGDAVALGLGDAGAFDAITLRDRDGGAIGLLAVAGGPPLPGDGLRRSVLSIYGARLAVELRHREARVDLRALFDAGEESVLVCDWDSGVIVDANARACERSGYAREELLGSTPAILASGLPPCTASDALRHIEALRAGAAPRFEWQRRNKDGSLHWDEVRLRRVVLDGRPCIAAFSFDITERKHVLEQLQLKEEQYRVIFEAASDSFVLRDRALRTLEANSAFYRMYGFERDQIAAGGGYPANFPPEYIHERNEQLRLALEGRETHVESLALRADGSSFWVDLRVIPVHYRGEPHVLQVVRDISKLRAREHALQLSEARLRATVEASFDAIIGMDAAGRIIEFNSAAELCFGHRRHDVIGRLLSETIIPPRHRQAHAHGLQRSLQGAPATILGRLIETTAIRSDGSEFPVELAISVGEGPDSKIFVGHVRDITGRLEAEREREALNAQLRQAQKMEAIGQLTGGIAHDFNNILTSVIGYIVLAMERLERSGDQRTLRQLEQAHLAAQRARELIQQMLTFARRGRSERKSLALLPVVRQCLTLLRATLPGSVMVETDFARRVPAVWADPLQIEQVLFNLCINARDAMHGEGRLQVRLGQRRLATACASCLQAVTGQWVALSVTDEGSGMSPEVRERMFDPFYTTKEVGHGSGMGLAMVHGIVHEHGGHVVVDSEVGAGSTFSVLLPVATTEPELPAADAEAHDRLDSAPHLQGRLLLVEDEAAVGAYMRELLEGWGLAVTHCKDPVDAMRRFGADPRAYDVVLTDQAMPRLVGSELAQRIVELRPDLPVLLYTGFFEGLDEAALKRRGVRAVLHKPVDRSVLLNALRDCLQG